MRGAGNRHPWPSRKRRKRGFFEAELSETLRTLNVER